MKDMPAMNQRDYDIGTSVTGDSGKEFLEIHTAEQWTRVTDILDLQRKPLQEIIEVRRAVFTETPAPRPTSTPTPFRGR